MLLRCFGHGKSGMAVSGVALKRAKLRSPTRELQHDQQSHGITNDSRGIHEHANMHELMRWRRDANAHTFNGKHQLLRVLVIADGWRAAGRGADTENL